MNVEILDVCKFEFEMWLLNLFDKLEWLNETYDDLCDIFLFVGNKDKLDIIWMFKNSWGI